MRPFVASRLGLTEDATRAAPSSAASTQRCQPKSGGTLQESQRLEAWRRRSRNGCRSRGATEIEPSQRDRAAQRQGVEGHVDDRHLGEDLASEGFLRFRAVLCSCRKGNTVPVFPSPGSRHRGCRPNEARWQHARPPGTGVVTSLRSRLSRGALRRPPCAIARGRRRTCPRPRPAPAGGFSASASSSTGDGQHRFERIGTARGERCREASSTRQRSAVRPRSPVSMSAHCTSAERAVECAPRCQPRGDPSRSPMRSSPDRMAVT